MDKFLPSAFVLTQLITCTIEQSAFQDYGIIPDKCTPRPKVLYHQCCIFPPFFTYEAARACGAHGAKKFVHEGTNITGFRRIIDIDCEYWTCILNKYHLMDAEGLVIDDKLFNHLDKWVDLNPPFAQVMLNAKLNCKTTYRSIMPFNACEYFDFHMCIRNFVKVRCPMVVQSPKCLEQKAFYDECSEYFI